LKTIARYLCALLALALFACASVVIARDGLSYFYLQQAIDSSSQASAEQAIRLNPSNPDAYHARGLLFQKQEQINAAISDLNRALDLRPSDHFLWLELGFCRYQNHDMGGAIADFRESARLAPLYAQPRWYLGNVLVQTGKPDEGFEEIRRAVSSEPAYLPDAIQLAADAYGGDARAIAQAIKPQSSINRLALAQYFLKQKSAPAALELFTETGVDISPADRATLVSELLAAKDFSEAYVLWRAGRTAVESTQTAVAAINDGSFENEIGPGARGFEWQLGEHIQKIAVERDQQHPESGSFSLRLSFNGASIPDTPIVSQTLLADSAVRYDLDFAYRTRQLVTGGPPLVAIIDAKSGQTLAQSKPLPENETEWSRQSVTFSTPSDTRAVAILIKRMACSSSPCPAFGYAWLDSFTLKKE
jgi:tetratricopeptide (TPR) repeat protein